MTKQSLLSALDQFQGKRVAVIGDVMLDIYHRGSVHRISPEAPVPVVSIDRIEYHPGGAANVAMNLVSLGAEAWILGLIGNDENGTILRSKLEDGGMNTSGLVETDGRPTTAKTRVIAGSQHVVRTDLEHTNPVPPSIAERLLNFLSNHIADFDAVIFEDYNKGLLQPDIITSAIEICRKHDVIVTVDPKFQHFFEYQNATLVKPNLKEVESILARPVQTEHEIQSAGLELLEMLHCQYLLITLGSRGMDLFSAMGEIEHLSTEARMVADVSGAGDTVIATLTLGLLAGITPGEAATLGNIAAGRVCEEIGIVPIGIDVLRESLRESMI